MYAETKDSAVWQNLSLAIGINHVGIPVLYDLKYQAWDTASLEYTWEDLVLAVEYCLWTTEPTVKFDNNIMPTTENDTIGEGYYGSALYRFTDWLEISMYHSVYYQDRDARM